MIPINSGKFRDAEGTAIYTFSGQGDNTLTYHEIPTDYDVTGERRSQWMPTRADLASVIGRYCTPDVPVCWSFLMVDENMVLRRPGFPDRTLKPAFADAFSTVDVDEIGTRSMRIILERAHDSSILGMKIFRGRVSGLAFKKAD